MTRRREENGDPGGDSRLIRTKRVTVALYDQLHIFELGIALEVLESVAREGHPGYEISFWPWDRGTLRTVSGLRLRPPASEGGVAPVGLRTESDPAADHTILLPGWRDIDEAPPQRAIERLVAAWEAGARLVSVCSGAFVLAATGLLDGRRATTHWRYAAELARRFPDVRVEPNVLYVADDRLMTSAGSSAGIDLCLHLVRLDYGVEIANRVARRLVMAPHREGGQAQFVETPLDTSSEPGALAELMRWVRTHLTADHDVASMAARIHVSPRTLSRWFLERTGIPPIRWLTQQRVELARRCLETTDATVSQIALDVGFGSDQLLRHHFRRLVGTTPTTYRRKFQLTRKQQAKLEPR